MPLRLFIYLYIYMHFFFRVQLVLPTFKNTCMSEMTSTKEQCINQWANASKVADMRDQVPKDTEAPKDQLSGFVGPNKLHLSMNEIGSKGKPSGSTIFGILFLLPTGPPGAVK